MEGKKQENMEAFKVSWEEIEQYVRKLAEKIKASGFVPDCIIGIATGGIIPMALLSKELGVDNITTVTSSSYEKHEQRELKISNLPDINLRGKKVLLVDEVAETGETLRQVSDLIAKKYQTTELKTATIGINKIKCKHLPDYVALERNDWIVFPWERKEFPEYFQ